MIAQPNQHYDPETLRQLLDESLSREQCARVEVHLSQCDQCRRQLEEIAGESQWWDETVSVLSQSTAANTADVRYDGPTSDQRRSIDSSLQWIRPLLEETPDGSSLGRIDQYLVHEVIGQGGMGVVLRGVDPQLNRPVAIKILSPHLAGVGAARMRFMREAQAAAAIVHPSIVPIYSVATSAPLPYIVMPCIGGGNLQQRIQREGPFEIAEVLRIGLQVAEGLSAAHRHGVIHRDIKPGNILVEEGNGRVLISDFGLARALDDATLTITGMITGTPQYMSPEQARGEPIDARSDLYSLGSLLYALATGRPPFRAESPLAVLRKISETRPRPIHEINERIPPWFDLLVSRLMTTEVSHRITDADSVSGLLRDAHAHVRNPSANALPRTLTPGSLVNRWVALAGMLLLLAGGLGYETLRRRAVGDKASDDRGGQVATVYDARQQNLAWNDPMVELELLSIQLDLDQLQQQMELNRPPETVFTIPTASTPRSKD